MKIGERRGPLPEEEYAWLRQHLVCRSIRVLFAEYSKVFGSPYFNVVSFREVMKRHDLFPITTYQPCENVNHLIEMYYQGPCHWTYKDESFRKGLIAEPHWLWKWHTKSIKTPSGTSFRPYPLKLKEKKFGETMDSGDPDQDGIS